MTAVVSGLGFNEFLVSCPPRLSRAGGDQCPEGALNGRDAVLSE